jgi:glycosyltransferase involved in cell wall biosynthesis
MILVKKRIGIVLLSLQPHKSGGGEAYLLNLLNGFRSKLINYEICIFCTDNNFVLFEQFTQDFTITKIKFFINNQRAILLYEWLFISRLLYKNKIDLVFNPFGYRYLFNLKKIKTLNTVHDIQFKILPEFSSRKHRFLRNIFMNIIVRYSDKIICISHSSKRELISYYPLSEAKIHVIYNPINFKILDNVKPVTDLPFKRHLEEDYVLYVGSYLPHKNVEFLIKAFKHIVEKNPRAKLILAGMKQTKDNSINNLILNLNLISNVEIIGYFSEDLKGSLYSYAKLFVYPSIYEGFGMPVVEAMYKKIPVITTNYSCLPEVSQGQAVYLNDISDENELADLIIEGLTNSRSFYNKDYAEISRNVSACYNIDEISRQYIQLFDLILLEEGDFTLSDN